MIGSVVETTGSAGALWLVVIMRGLPLLAARFLGAPPPSSTVPCSLTERRNLPRVSFATNAAVARRFAAGLR